MKTRTIVVLVVAGAAAIAAVSLRRRSWPVGVENGAADARASSAPAPDDVVRSYLDQAEHYLALAASVLGEREAARLAMETRGGPVIRDCSAP